MNRPSAGDCPVQYIRGLPYPDVPWLSKQNVEDTMDYMPQTGDIIVASYPKTGSTWLQYIIVQILSKGEKYPTIDDLINKEMPFPEMTGTKLLESLPKPRLYKIHLPYNMVQKNDEAKCIYIYRNPADTVVSYHPFMQGLIPEVDLDFNDFLDRFVSGIIGFGSYFDHVLSFYRYRGKENLLMVSYEKLLANRKDEILRIAKFLGEDYHQMLLEDEALLDKIIEHTSFDYMKKNLSMTHPTKYEEKDEDGKNAVSFFRKGVAGDGKNVLTDTQQQKLKDTVKNLMEGTEIAEEWLKY